MSLSLIFLSQLLVLVLQPRKVHAMLDPVTIIRSSVSLVKVCIELHLFFKTVRDGDPIIQALVQEMRDLQIALGTVQRVAESALVAKLVAHQWQTIHGIISECHETLTSLKVVLGNPTTNHRQADFLKRSWRQFKTELKAREIAGLQSKMASHQRMLTLSIQIIML